MPMPAPAPQEAQNQPPQEGGGMKPSEMVSTAMSSLMALGDVINQSQAISEPEKQEYNQIVSAFKSFIEKLGQAPGGEQPGPQAPGGQVPMGAGANPNVKPAY